MYKRQTLVREFPGIEIGGELRIRLSATPGSKAPPVLCGVEFLADTKVGSRE